MKDYVALWTSFLETINQYGKTEKNNITKNKSTNDLRSIFIENIHFKKLMKLENLLKYFIVA